jgi:type II secretory pathway component PulJ
MKTFLIISALLIFALITLVLWCCLVVASRADNIEYKDEK